MIKTPSIHVNSIWAVRKRPLGNLVGVMTLLQVGAERQGQICDGCRDGASAESTHRALVDLR